MTFAPESWGEVEIFIRFGPETYPLSDLERRVLGGVRRHFEKALNWRSLAAGMIPAVEAEQLAMNRAGYTAGTMRRNAGQVVEASIHELYAALDGTASTLHAIYAKTSRGFQRSTSRLFAKAQEINGSFPDALKVILAAAVWERPLRHLRDELIHASSGACDWNEASGAMGYSHFCIKQQGRVLEVENVLTWLDEWIERVNRFTGAAFGYLNGTLDAKPLIEMCGIINGTVALIRELSPSERPFLINSGSCRSWLWIEDPEQPTCPLIAQCGAYRRARPEHDPQAVLASKRNPEPWALAAEPPRPGPGRES